MNLRSVNGQILRRRHAGLYLSAAGIHALNIDRIAGLNSEARGERAIPNGVRWFRGKCVLRHGTVSG
jgi:hypothetical protein